MLKGTTYAALALGLLAALVMVLWQGFGVVAHTIALVGWWFPSLVLWYVVPAFAMGASWSMVFPPGVGPSLLALTYINYLGSSVNALLPVGAVGGEVVKALMVVRRGVAGAMAGAAVVTDKAAQAASQLAFGLIGVGALIYLEAHRDLVAGLLGATVFFCFLLGAFFWFQREGMFSRLARGLERVTRGRLWWNVVGSAAQLDEALDQIYGHRLRITAACSWRLVARLLFVVETWAIAQWMGYPIGWIEALMIESLTQTVRGMAFVVPSGLGAQEGAFLLLAGAAGLPPEVALSISLVKRGREIVAGAPALLALQWGAGKGLLASRRGG